jgi:hypothetical protein
LTPASPDGGAWIARVLTPRARALFRADEIALVGWARQWVLLQAAEGGLVVD